MKRFNDLNPREKKEFAERLSALPFTHSDMIAVLSLHNMQIGNVGLYLKPIELQKFIDGCFEKAKQS
jgi:hypothetical protein